jgi:hypothetical protein
MAKLSLLVPVAPLDDFENVNAIVTIEAIEMAIGFASAYALTMFASSVATMDRHC